MSHDHHEHASKWKHDGVRVIPGNTLDPNTAQNASGPKAAILRPRRCTEIWAGTVSIQPT